MCSRTGQSLCKQWENSNYFILAAAGDNTGIPVDPDNKNTGTSCLAVTKNASAQNCTLLERPLAIMQSGEGEGICLVQVTMLVASQFFVL